MKWNALFVFMLANMIVCTAYAQAPFPATTQKGPAGSPPEAQAPFPATTQKGPAGSPPEAQAPFPATTQKGFASSPPGSPPEAQAPLSGAATQNGRAGAVARVEDIITAIEVADMLTRGVNYSRIATLLSYQRGFDRGSALKKGETDEQITKYLITKTRNIPAMAGGNESKLHEYEGDKQYREFQYGKAAKEYTLAIEYSADRYSPSGSLCRTKGSPTTNPLFFVRTSPRRSSRS